jgi:hypothetical protein
MTCAIRQRGRFKFQRFAAVTNMGLIRCLLTALSPTAQKGKKAQITRPVDNCSALSR